MANDISWALRPMQRLSVERLKSRQEDFLHLIESGRDGLVILPTGYGKSLAYQLAPYVNSKSDDHSSTVFVVMPLVALMKQQCDNLKKANMNPVYASDGTVAGRCAHSLSSYSHIFLTPEMLKTMLPMLLALLPSQRAIISHIFVDESHCVAKWGQANHKTAAFRKEYGEIGSIRTLLPSAAMFALTATATPSIVKVISAGLCMNEKVDVIRVTPDKVNIRYCVIKPKERSYDACFSWICCHLNSEPPSNAHRMLIFCRQLKYIGEIYSYLSSRCPAGTIEMYHRQTSETIQDRIAKDICSAAAILRVVVCSSSFSMGMDIPSLYYVIHYGMPTSLDDYVQETGRAGRDDKQSHAIVYAHKDCNKGANMSVESKDYSSASRCLRKQILTYFGENPAVEISSYLCCSYCASAYSCCSCPLVVTCLHALSSVSCFCVKQCPLLPLPFRHLQQAPEVSVWREDMSAGQLQRCYTEMYNLSDEVTPVYAQLIDNILKNHRSLSEATDIMDMGAYSLAAANSLLTILNAHSPLLEQPDIQVGVDDQGRILFQIPLSTFAHSTLYFDIPLSTMPVSSQITK